MPPCGSTEKPIAAPAADTPRVYLCQVSDTLSCGACCGLYNVAPLSRDALTEMLLKRTSVFATVPRTIADIDAFAAGAEGFSPPQRPFPRFHHCPFTGLIDGGRRVGCLLHPLAEGNEGVDWRGLSYYGGYACRSYFCPSTRLLAPAYLLIVRQAFDHWYDYGLMLTERSLLSAAFEVMEARMGLSLDAADDAQCARAATVVRKLAALHRRWPYRWPDAPGPSNYFFENDEYPRPPVVRCGGRITLSRYENIFRELESAFSSDEDIQRAEGLVDDLFEGLRPLRVRGRGHYNRVR